MMSTDEFDFRAHRLQATESTMHCYVLLFFPSPCQQASLIWAHSICQNLHWKQPMHVHLHSDITWRNLIEVENPWACLKLPTACMRVAAASIQCGGAGAAHGLSESQLDSFCQRKHPAESCLFIEDRLAVWFRTARWKTHCRFCDILRQAVFLTYFEYLWLGLSAVLLKPVGFWRILGKIVRGCLHVCLPFTFSMGSNFWIFLTSISIMRALNPFGLWRQGTASDRTLVLDAAFAALPAHRSTALALNHLCCPCLYHWWICEQCPVIDFSISQLYLSLLRLSLVRLGLW